MRVVILPGVCGSEILLDYYVSTQPFWYKPGPLIALGPAPLRVNNAGTGDFGYAGVRRTVLGFPIPNYYDPLREFFIGRGDSVYSAGYDWRLSVRAEAERLWPEIRAWSGGSQVYLLGHSLGGMVGRAIMRVAEGAGQLGEIVRLVQLGTPNWGTVTVPATWGHLSVLWHLLGKLFSSLVLRPGRIFRGKGIFSLVTLDTVIGSLVSPYELLPQDGSPELSAAYTHADAMNPRTYDGQTTGLLDARFGPAADFQTWIQASIYPEKMLSVIGTGTSTADQVTNSAGLINPIFYHWGEGDGTVSVRAAALPTVPFTFADGVSHQELVLDGGLMARLPSLLANGHD